MSRSRLEIVDAIKSSIGADETPQTPSPEPLHEIPQEPSPEIPQTIANEPAQQISMKDLKKDIKKAFKLINSNPSFPLVLNKQVMNSMEDLQRVYGELSLQESQMKTAQREAKKIAKKASLERKRSEFLDKYKDHAEELQMNKSTDDYPEDEYRIQDGVVRRLGRVCGVVPEEEPNKVIEVPKLSKHDIDEFLDTHKDYILDRLKEADKSKSKTVVGEFLKEKSEEPSDQVMYKGTNSFSNGFSNKVIEQWFSRYPSETPQPKINQPPPTIHQNQFFGLNPALFGR